MKGFILSMLSLAMLLFILSGCGEDSATNQFDEEENLVGYLDSFNRALYVKPEFRDSVLAVLLSGEHIQDSSAYFIIETLSPLNFSYFFDSLWVDSVRHYYPTYSDLKIYINADCGKVHSGFTSDCIGTFGEHRFWGRSMKWTVKEWRSCTSGSSICIEKYERIGEIIYYQDDNCLFIDTLTITRGIYEWACIL